MAHEEWDTGRGPRKDDIWYQSLSCVVAPSHALYEAKQEIISPVFVSQPQDSGDWKDEQGVLFTDSASTQLTVEAARLTRIFRGAET